MTSARWRNPVVRQWALMLAILGVLTALCSWKGVFWRFDMLLYDTALPTAAAPADVVIVAIDDASIAQLGRWPWRRSLHAALLRRLHAMGARAVALDLLLTEPETADPAADADLAAAMVLTPTVLPLLVEMPDAGMDMQVHTPIAIFTQAAAGVGHAHLELDRDGVVRSVYLQEGIGAPQWPHFTAALLMALPLSAPLVLPGARHPDLPGAANVWVRDHKILIPYLGRPGSFPTLSYVDVLRGAVGDRAVRGKFILVGATAQGVGDAYPTPRSGEGRAMAGVEIAANVLQALRNGTEILPLARVPAAALTVLPVLAAALCLLLLAPRWSVLLIVCIIVATAGGSVWVLRAAGWWWPPAASLLALTLIYPVWSWRRLAAMQSFLEGALAQLAAERFPLLSGLPATAATSAPVEFLEQRMEMLRGATERLRAARSLFADTVTNLPDATIVVDAAGRIVLANQAAAQLFGVLEPQQIEARLVDTQLHARVLTDESRFVALSAHAPCCVEAVLTDTARVVLIRAVPFCTETGARIGVILALADITDLRAAQAERDDVLKFLSHDMKSPASSLLGLAQLQRDSRRALPPEELSVRLDLLAQRLLALVDGFVGLARAGSVDPGAFEAIDAGDAVRDAYDEVWASAHARGSTINLHMLEESPLVHGDRRLLARAVVNLLGNAVKFSQPGATVDVTCQRVNDDVMIKVADHGPGIAPEFASQLFQKFSRGIHRGMQDPGGAGLGLAFVRVVAEKHGGRAWVDNAEGYGAVFCLALPVMPEGGQSLGIR